MFRSVCLAAIVSFAFAGCGGGAGDAAPESALAAVEQLAEEGLCTSPQVTEPADDELDIGVEPPEQEAACDIDGGDITATKFADDDALRGVLRVGVEFAAAFGIDGFEELPFLVFGDGWAVSVELDGDEVVTDESRALLDEVREVIGGDVTTTGDLLDG